MQTIKQITFSEALFMSLTLSASLIAYYLIQTYLAY